MIKPEATVLTELMTPFPPQYISWKPGALNSAAKGRDDGKQPKTLAMAYGDLRAYMRRLDAVLGLNWESRTIPWGDKRIIVEITLTVMVDGEARRITRSGTGEFDEGGGKDAPEGTAAEAQAFKRACAMFGLGRYLYEIPSQWVLFDPASKQIAPDGRKILEAEYKRQYDQMIAKIKASRPPIEESEVQPVPPEPKAEAQAAPKQEPVKKAAPVVAEKAAPAVPVVPVAPVTTDGHVWEGWINMQDARAWASAQGLKEPEIAPLAATSLKEGNGLSAKNRAALEIFYNKVMETKKNG